MLGMYQTIRFGSSYILYITLYNIWWAAVLKTRVSLFSIIPQQVYRLDYVLKWYTK